MQRMDLGKYPLDLILVPLSLLLTASYHGCVWFRFKAKPHATTIGLTLSKRATWSQTILQDRNKLGMLGVQSLRNSLMSAILSASIAIAMATSLAALANNAYNSRRRLLRFEFFGSQEGPTVVLKYASALLFLLFSFVSNSLAIGSIIDANFLINSAVVASDVTAVFDRQAYRMLRRGCVLAVVGNRVLFVTFPLLLWFLGPVAMAVSSIALLAVFYGLDFIRKYK